MVARGPRRKLETGQGAKMAHALQIVFRVERLDVNAFRRMPDQVVDRLFQLLLGQGFPVCSGGGALVHIDLTQIP